jgi:hypothetical protein
METAMTTRSLDSLAAIDYADLFTVDTTAEATPEQWARAMFGHVPSAAQIFIWRWLLGLRLSRGGRSPETVAGWRIGGRGDEWIRLEAASWFLSAGLTVETGGGQVGLRTTVHYDRPIGRVVWPPCSAVHRRLVPGVLRTAAVKIQGRVR